MSRLEALLLGMVGALAWRVHQLVQTVVQQDTRLRHLEGRPCGCHKVAQESHGRPWTW